MKNTVINALRGDATDKKRFNTLLSLFIKHPEHNEGQARYFNRAGFSPENYKMLVYDVKQLNGIRDLDLATAPKMEVVKTEDVLTPEEKLLAIDFETASEDDLKILSEVLEEYSSLNVLFPSPTPAFTKGLPGNKEMKEYLVSLGRTPTKKKKADLLNEIGNVRANLIDDAYGEAAKNMQLAQAGVHGRIAGEATAAKDKQNSVIVTAYNEAAGDVKDGVKLRGEFPFLRDDDCPDKLKVLVADKFTALEKFESAHEEIQKKVANGETDELYDLAKKAVENWELNQEIYDELNYYQEYKEILGNHPIFEADVLLKKVTEFSIQEAMKRQGNLRSYISRDTAKLEKMKDANKKEKAAVKIAEWQKELDLIDKRLAKDDKK